MTDNYKYLTKIFKRARLKVVKKNPRLFNLLKINNELKDSELEEKFKTSIYSEVISKCSVEFGIIVLDTLSINVVK